MGCDIHLFVETRESESAPWVLTRVEAKCDFCEGKGSYENGEACYRCKGSTRALGYHARNYDAFAILANVRNGYGFAGCDTGDGFVPISEPRDLPDDISGELALIRDDNGEGGEDLAEERGERNRKAWGESWLGDHSHSWVSLAELLAYDWKRATKKRGEMSLGAWAAWKKSGATVPQSYCGGCSGSMVRHVNETVAAALVECIEFAEPSSRYDEPEPKTKAFTDVARTAWKELAELKASELDAWERGELRLSVYVPVQWQETYADCAGALHSSFIPALVALGKDPQNVRLVFGFDS